MRQFKWMNGRLEPLNKVYSIEEGVQARIKDPLWMLGRQWQTEEFMAGGEGQIALTDVEYKTEPVEQIALGNIDPPNTSFENFDLGIPVENLVEKENDEQTSPGWDPKRLEYNFWIKSKSSKFKAAEYTGEKLDWYTMDITKTSPLEGDNFREILKPDTVRFSGMPSARWWEFEDQKVNLGLVQRPYLNYLTMLLIEFGLVYSQDWYLIPIEHPVGHLRQMDSIKTIDTFGFTTSAQPITDASESNEHLEFFTLTSKSEEPGKNNNRLFYMPNNLWKEMEGDPFEQVSFIRDEAANLCWGVEHKVLKDGMVINRHDSTQESGIDNIGFNDENKPKYYYDKEQKELIERPEDFETGVKGQKTEGPVSRYQEDRIPPRFWIPYLQQFRNKEVIIRRATTYPGETQFFGKLIEESKIIFEEEVTRVGVVVNRTHQLARDMDGNRVAWKSRKKRPDRPRNSSGLAFDQLIEE